MARGNLSIFSFFHPKIIFDFEKCPKMIRKKSLFIEVIRNSGFSTEFDFF